MAGENPNGHGRVVVGVDGSPSSLEALQWAAAQAERLGTGLEIVAAWDWPHSYGWAVPLPADYNPEADAEKLAGDCAGQVREKHPGLDVVAATAQGHPAPVLVDASRGAALVVVGSRGHGEFAGMLLGSVSEHVTAHAHCPVVVIRGHRHGAHA